MNKFPCRECGGKTFVTDSREGTAFEMKSVRRRRKCEDCEQRFTTFEVHDDDLAQVDRIVYLCSELVRNMRKVGL